MKRLLCHTFQGFYIFWGNGLGTAFLGHLINDQCIMCVANIKWTVGCFSCGFGNALEPLEWAKTLMSRCFKIFRYFRRYMQNWMQKWISIFFLQPCWFQFISLGIVFSCIFLPFWGLLLRHLGLLLRQLSEYQRLETCLCMVETRLVASPIATHVLTRMCLVLGCIAHTGKCGSI